MQEQFILLYLRIKKYEYVTHYTYTRKHGGRYTGKRTGYSLSCFLSVHPLFPRKVAGRQAELASRPVRVVSSNRISRGRERDDKPVCCRALSLLKYITHSKWSCWSQTAVDLITPRALCGRGAF